MADGISGLGLNPLANTSFPGTSSNDAGLGFGGSQFGDMFARIQQKIAAQQASNTNPDSVKELLAEKMKTKSTENHHHLSHFLKQMLSLLEDPKIQDELKLDSTQLIKIQSIEATFTTIQKDPKCPQGVVVESTFIAIASIGRALTDTQFSELLKHLLPPGTDADIAPASLTDTRTGASTEVGATAAVGATPTETIDVNASAPAIGA